jgi:hypothetical protein
MENAWYILLKVDGEAPTLWRLPGKRLEEQIDESDISRN